MNLNFRPKFSKYLGRDCQIALNSSPTLSIVFRALSSEFPPIAKHGQLESLSAWSICPVYRVHFQ